MHHQLHQALDGRTLRLIIAGLDVPEEEVDEDVVHLRQVEVVDHSCEALQKLDVLAPKRDLRVQTLVVGEQLR